MTTDEDRVLRGVWTEIKSYRYELNECISTMTFMRSKITLGREVAWYREV